MAAFGGSGNDLAALIAYEREALEFVRTTLFDQTEAASSPSLTLNLSETKKDGYYPRHIGLTAAGFFAGAEAVRSALSRLRPLAFSTAFKMQDMIVEWILHANGSRAWGFSEKIAKYDAMERAGTFCEPVAFAKRKVTSKAFWELYKALTPFRNEIIHKNSFSLKGSTLTVSAKGKTLNLSDKQQGSYIRAICLIADALVSGAEIEVVKGYIIENDLHGVGAVHSISGLSAQEVRTESVTVVSPGHKNADGRIEANVDFDDIRRNAEAAWPTGPACILLFDLTLIVEADNRQVKWVFPPTTLPVGTVRVAENDPDLEPYRS
jgi:hypothetical protein